MSLLTKLLAIQKEVDSFTKDKKGHNYTYTTGDQVLNKIRPLMNKKKLLLKQEVVEVANKKVEYETKYGQKAEMFTSTKQLFTWIDTESEETLEVQWHGNGMNDWDKGLGSSLTYGERYFLLKFFHVPTDEDDPDTNQKPRSKQSKGSSDDDKPWLNKTEYKSDELTDDWKKVTKRVRNKPEDLDKVYDHYKVNKDNRKELESIAEKAKEASPNGEETEEEIPF